MAFAFFVLSQLDVMPGLRWQRRLRSAGVGIRTQQPNGRHGRHGRGNRLHLPQQNRPVDHFPGKKAETWFWMVLDGSGWWLTYPSEKYEFVSWDDSSQPYGKIKAMFQSPPTSNG